MQKQRPNLLELSHPGVNSLHFNSSVISATQYPLESKKAPLAILFMLDNNWTSLTALTKQQLPHFLLSSDDYLHAKNKICQLLQDIFELGKNCLGKD